MNRVWRRISPVQTALLVGVLFSLITVSFRIVADEFYGYGTLSIELIWVVGGTFILVFVPTFILAKYRIVLPAIFSVGLYLATAIYSLDSIVTSLQTDGAGLTPTWFELVLGLWFLPLLVALTLGGVEYAIRQRSTSRQPPSTQSEP